MSTEIPVTQYKKSETFEKAANAWWRSERVKACTDIWSKVKQIRQQQSSRRGEFLRFARLYCNTDFDQFLNGVTNGSFGRRLSFNVSRSCVDTACAKISKSKTRPLILTTKGNQSQSKRAKLLTQYLDGMYDSTKIYRHGKRSFRESCIFGTGILKVFIERGEVKTEKVFIDELVVDDLDGRAMAPREMHQVKMIPREVALDLYGEDAKAKEAIKNCSTYWEIAASTKTKADLIGIIESWHLPSGPEATDGKHVISVENYTLVFEDYKKDYFPFVYHRWNEPVMGWYGDGIVSQLVGIQLEINTVLIRIKESQELVAVPRVLVEKGSGVNASHITDEIGGIIYYTGAKPDFNTPRGMNKEAYDWVEYLYRKAFEETGISQLSATSKKPAGLDSRVALREYQDIETERFVLVGERYQDMFIDAGRMFIDLQRDLAKEDSKLSIKVKGKDFIETIKWKDCDLEDDKFLMTVYPTNFLPRTPEGQLETIQELIQSGFIEDASWAMSLLNYPDLQDFIDVKTAALDDVKLVIEMILEEGRYTAPEPYMDLALAIKMVQSAYLRGKTTDVPEERLELLRKFIDACQDIMLKATAPPTSPLTTPAAPTDPNQPLAPVQNAVAGIAGLPAPAIPGAIAQPIQPPVSDLMPVTQ